MLNSFIQHILIYILYAIIEIKLQAHLNAIFSCDTTRHQEVPPYYHQELRAIRRKDTIL